MAVVLIGGGARSGKTKYALQIARERGSKRFFIATSVARDAEKGSPVSPHPAQHSDDFTAIEDSLELGRAIRQAEGDVILVDGLTVWLSHVVHTFGRDVNADTEAMLDAARESAATVIFVTEELGCGITPENIIGRDFRDRVGILNQRVAAIAQEVYWMAFGCPLRVK